MSVSGWPFTGAEMHEFLSNEVNNFSCSSLFLSTFLHVFIGPLVVNFSNHRTLVFLLLVRDHILDLLTHLKICF